MTRGLFNAALTSGCIGSYFFGKAMQWSTNDWVVKGQSLLDRQLDKAGWYAIGFVAGAGLGAFLAFTWMRAGTRRRG
ncbi:hypothetical protein QLQ15_05065 [Lysobacter sp. LF1]|uniref:Uncharacterized protein n=1 Tax=Lysobacter stagni TaxID=3045172 RepID=A0ABT6XDR3_9GAMM|nr:hypothetical protein [Lysobacter sp. LF1]MDI9238281.1 hypothetical protein [Lysobacter sp. LF1]